MWGETKDPSYYQRSKGEPKGRIKKQDQSKTHSEIKRSSNKDSDVRIMNNFRKLLESIEEHIIWKRGKTKNFGGGGGKFWRN